MNEPTEAKTTRNFFSRETTVSADILSPAERIWKLLTTAETITAWNTTIVEFSGKIAPGETIQLRSTLAPERSFALKIKEFNPPTLLSWGDMMGTRTYHLSPNPQGGTRFTMTEKIGGPLFPLFASSIPSFDASFNKIAHDLKQAAEAPSET